MLRYIKNPDWKVYTITIICVVLYITFDKYFVNNKTVSERNCEILNEEAEYCLLYHPRYVKDAYNNPVIYEFSNTETHFYVTVFSKVSIDDSVEPHLYCLYRVTKSITLEELEKNYNEVN